MSTSNLSRELQIDQGLENVSRWLQMNGYADRLYVSMSQGHCDLLSRDGDSTDRRSTDGITLCRTLNEVMLYTNLGKLIYAP
jgi:uncharacterized protein with PIN domain